MNRPGGRVDAGIAPICGAASPTGADGMYGPAPRYRGHQNMPVLTDSGAKNGLWELSETKRGFRPVAFHDTKWPKQLSH